jgi:TATA-box binding protein (TBP) (component of TFIID and TFIIIB)
MEGVELPPTLRISTITATSKINCLVDIAKVYETLEVNDCFKYIEYGPKPNKGVSQKHISEKKRKNKKVFFNQITVEVVCDKVTNNIKLFNNGSISMTGIKDIEIGKNSISMLFRYLLDKDGSVFGIPDPDIMFFRIVLINSDFKLDFEIKRSELHQILVNDYGVYSSYEPCIYPGVNSKYYWNSKYQDRTYNAIGFEIVDHTVYIEYDIINTYLTDKLRDELNSKQHKETFSETLSSQLDQTFVEKDILFDMTNINLRAGIKIAVYDPNIINTIRTGIDEKKIKIDINYKYKGACYCDGHCIGKGNGEGETECKKVTISAFQSGSIIITGANTTRQIYESYHFINNVINRNIGTIKKNITSQKKMDEIIYIKKSSITCA